MPFNNVALDASQVLDLDGHGEAAGTTYVNMAFLPDLVPSDRVGSNVPGRRLQIPAVATSFEDFLAPHYTAFKRGGQVDTTGDDSVSDMYPDAGLVAHLPLHGVIDPDGARGMLDYYRSVRNAVAYRLDRGAGIARFRGAIEDHATHRVRTGGRSGSTVATADQQDTYEDCES
jgi:hypothetical protein